ncbi:MAG: NAD-binding protein [Kangiellaceae bacterium]|jgi:voltage-gated potassium channel|nr:NAD-binding protein [Kangiellaceae bacterium]
MSDSASVIKPDKLTIAIFGCNPSGFEVAQSLSRESTYQITLYDHNQAAVMKANALGYQAQYAQFSQDSSLIEIGLQGDIDILYALLPNESDNVFLSLSARSLNKKLRILSLAEHADAHEKLVAAGADKVVDVYQLSAHRVHQLMTRPLVVDMLQHTLFGQQDLELVEFAITNSSPLIGTAVADLDLANRYNLVLLGVLDRTKHQELSFATHWQEHTLAADDVLVLIGADADLTRLKHNIG